MTLNRVFFSAEIDKKDYCDEEKKILMRIEKMKKLFFFR
jgi:hypothetical protein